MAAWDVRLRMHGRDSICRVDLHEVAVVRVVVGMNDQRRKAHSRAVRVEQPAEIDVEQHVAVDQKKGVRELAGDFVQPAGRTKRHLLAVHADA